MRAIRIVAALFVLASAAAAQTPEPWSGTYLYDGTGNIKAIGQNRYVYDGARRLRQGTAITSAQHDVQQYGYDAFGNLLSIGVAGNPAQTLSAGVDHATNRASDPGACPQGATCFFGTYDEGGNQVTFGATAYAYDSDNAIVNLDAPGRNQIYLYDASGERIATVAYASAGSQTWHYSLRDGAAQVAREIDDVVSGSAHAYAWKKDYVHPQGRLLASIRPDSAGEVILHLHADHLGTPRLITNSVGRRISVHTYWPFGREAVGSDADDETIKFTGQERDASGDGNDLDYMHARYYSNAAARFLSIDPVLGVKRALAHPQAWNRYAYVLDQPIRMTDPDGQYTVDCTQGSEREKKKCQAAAARFEFQREQALLSSDQNVRSAAMVWGGPQDVNGITAKFRPGGQVERDSDPGAIAFVNPFGSKDGVVNIVAEFNYSLNARVMGQTMAHEGSHVEDDLRFINSWDPVTRTYDGALNFLHFDTEFKAYETGSIVKPYREFQSGPAGYPALEQFLRDHVPHANDLVFDPDVYKQR